MNKHTDTRTIVNSEIFERERERRNERDKRDKMFEYIGFYLISYFLLSSN